MRRWLLLGIPIASFLALFGFLRFVVQPWGEIYALAEAQSLISKHSGFEMAATSLNLSWIPLKVTVSDIRLRPKDPKEFGFDMLSAKEAEARLDFLQLLGGRLVLSVVGATGLELKLDLDPLLKDDGKDTEIPWDLIFNRLETLPLRTVALRDTQLQLHSKKLKLNVEINDLAMRLINQGDRFRVQLQTGQSQLDYDHLKIPWVFGGDATATRQEINVSTLQLRTAKQSIEAKGKITNLPELLTAPKGQLQLTAHSDLEEVSTLLRSFTKIPSMSGQVELDSQVELRGKNLPTATLKLKTNEIVVADAEIGTVETEGSFDGSKLSLPLATIKHSSGQADIKDLRLTMENTEGSFVPSVMNIKSLLKTSSLDLRKLLIGIDVGDIPVELTLGAELDCGGPLMPKPNVVCVGSATGKNLDIHTTDDHVKPPKKNPLVKLAAFEAEGGLQITDEAITYQARAKIGKDNGTSSGLISYEKGFVIQYETPSVNLDHIKEIAGLGLSGIASIRGSTSGDSHAATFEMDIKASDLVFEDFILGNTEGKIRYNSGHLYFDNVTGQINQSAYQAQIETDLLKSRLKVTGSSESLQLEDLLKVLGRKFTMPVSLTGVASIKAQVEGPFELGGLSYQLSAKIPRLEVATESFSAGELEIRSVNGNVKTEKAVFRKGSQLITINGTADPHGQILVDLVGNQLLLEESENVSRIASSISGFLDVGMQVKGFILNPEVALQLQLGQMLIEDQEFPPSAASFIINNKQIEGSVRLFAGRLFGDFNWPFADNIPFRVKMQASEWNFATMATLIGAGNLLSEYESSVTGELSLSSEKGGFWKSSGKGVVHRMLLRRGQQALRNVKPMTFAMNQGVATLENWRLEGPQDFIDISAQSLSREQLRMKVDSHLSLRILQLFVPFLEELGGDGQINVAISGALEKPEVLGTAQLREGFARLRGFPHPLERASANLQFSASRISISDIKAAMAGGVVSGDGSILIVGPRNLPINIRASVVGATVQVPEKVETTGDLDLTFSGNWFPYTLSGTYRVNGGLFSKELESDSSAQRVQQSSYLPQVIQQNSFEPVLLDLQVDLIRPITLKNSLIEGRATGNLQIKGPPASPVLLGQIDIPSGAKVTFRDRVFEIVSGNLKFTNPKELNPELYFSARTRVQDYDISMLVQGTANEPILRLSSMPPLSDQDIITLLALGVTSQKFEKQVSSSNRAKESSPSYEIGTAILQNSPLAKSLEKTLGLSLQFSSNYDDTRNVNVQKITLSRQVSDRVNVSISQARSELNTTEAKIRYNFNPNLSAIGFWEGRERAEGASVTTTERASESIFGLDLEFKQEFK